MRGDSHSRSQSKAGGRQIWRIVVFASMLAAIVVVSSIIFVSAQSTSAQTGVQHDDTGPQSLGIFYRNPTSPPKISRDQAIAAAEKWLGPVLTGEATQVKAQYVLFSNYGAYSTDTKGKKHYLYENVPAWVVTFEGLNVPSSGGGRPAHGSNQNTIKYNHEMNVVINAQSGEYMEAFTYQ